MAPKKLTDEEQAFVDYWSQRMFYFMKNMRRANLYVLTKSRETYEAAYNEVVNSGRMVGGEWNSQNEVPIRWEPKPENREAYVDSMQSLVDDNPLTSPKNAVTVLLACNAGGMCILRCIVGDKPRIFRKLFWNQVHKLNNKDLADTKDVRYGRKPFSTLTDGDIASGSNEGPSDMHLSPDPNAPSTSSNDIANGEDEDNKPFTRSKEQPTMKIPPGEWKQYEAIGRTYFSEDVEDETGYIAFELTGMTIRKTGVTYEIRYEDRVSSIQLTEEELLGMVDDGMWV